MTLALIFNILILGITLGAQLITRPFSSKGGSASGGLFFLRWMFLIALLEKLAHLIYLTIAQYLAWLQNPVASLMLPPYRSFSYFTYYAFMEFWIELLVSLGIGLIFWFLMRRGNARFQNQFLYAEEPLLVLLCFLIIGHPLWIAYLPLLLLATLLTALYHNVLRNDPRKISLRYFWVPVALFTLIFSSYFEGWIAHIS